MRYLILLFSLTTGFYSFGQSAGPGQFMLTGSITGLNKGFVYLKYRDVSGNKISDSAVVDNGNFRFRGTIGEPTLATFYAHTNTGSDMDRKDYTRIFLEPGEMQLTAAKGAFDETHLSGSVTQTEYESYQQQERKLEQRWAIVNDTLTEVNKRSNFEYQALKDWVLTPYFQERKEMVAAFIQEHPTSYVTALLTTFELHNGISDDSLRKIYTVFPEKLQKSPDGMAIITELENRKKGVPGAIAAAFSTTDINNHPIALSDYKGKYVLLDFWASWCLPCRKGNPHLKELYARYKEKGFEVIGVASDDTRPDAWKAAVAKDGLPWRHVLSGLKIVKGDYDHSEDILAKYNVGSLPTQILIDPSGKIIGRYDEESFAHGELDTELAKVLTGLAQAQQFTLKGTITGQQSGKLKLYYTDKDGKRATDSSLIKNGQFTFRGAIAEPAMAYLEGAVKSRNMDDPNTTSFFLEPAPMTIHLQVNDFKNAVITGSKSQDEYAALAKLKAPVYKEMEPLSKSYKAAGEAYNKAVKAKKDDVTIDTLKYRAAAIHDQFDPYFAREAQIDYGFFAAHPQSYVTAFELRFHVSSLPLDSVQLFYDALGSTIQQSSSGKEIAKEIAKLRAGSPGSVATDFTAKELNGSTLTLSTLKGKYVLIDFWASWCVPCRKSMPHVKELYSRYKDKGFEVIGVSDDDRDNAAWEKAVAKDGTGIWHNVLRGLDWEKLRKNEKNDKDISDKFGIHSLPTKILIDPNGMIIGRYDKGTEEEAEAMDKKIAEAFAKGTE